MCYTFYLKKSTQQVIILCVLYGTARHHIKAHVNITIIKKYYHTLLLFLVVLVSFCIFFQEKKQELHCSFAACSQVSHIVTQFVFVKERVEERTGEPVCQSLVVSFCLVFFSSFIGLF